MLLAQCTLPVAHTPLRPSNMVSTSIRLLDLATGKRARKLSAGHAGAVRQLVFSADGRYLASSASSARFANVFDVAGDSAPSEPVATLGFAATPAFLAVHARVSGDEGSEGAGGGAGDQVTVVAGFDTGGVSVLRTRLRPDGKGDPLLVLVSVSVCVCVFLSLRASWGTNGAKPDGKMRRAAV